MDCLIRERRTYNVCVCTLICGRCSASVRAMLRSGE